MERQEQVRVSGNSGLCRRAQARVQSDGRRDASLVAGAVQPGVGASPDYDLLLAKSGGGLEVTVLKAGRPVRHARVRLVGERNPPLEPWSAVQWRKARSELVGGHRRDYATNDREYRRITDILGDILEPLDWTDDRGVATFTNLAPGTYRIIAGSDHELLESGALPTARLPADIVVAQGVTVRAGETTEYSLAIIDQKNICSLQLMQSNGEPVEAGTAELHWRKAEGGDATDLFQLDVLGTGAKYFDLPGIVPLSLRYRDFPEGKTPIELPWYDATAFVGTSPLLGTKQATKLRAKRVTPGSLKVQLEDADGKPVSGYVVVDPDRRGWGAWAGSTDVEGNIRFDGVAAAERRLVAYLKESPLPAFGFADDPFPDDKVLVGQQAFFDRCVTSQNNAVVPVTLCAEKVGYVRGVVRAPEGLSCADFYLGDDFQRPTACSRYDAKTGEFVAGPFSVGKAHVVLRRRGDDSTLPAAQQEIEVAADRVAHLELAPLAKPDLDYAESYLRSAEWVARSGGKAMLPYQDGPRGTVTLADGTTPAVNAEVLAFFPPLRMPLRAVRSTRSASSACAACRSLTVAKRQRSTTSCAERRATAGRGAAAGQSHAADHRCLAAGNGWRQADAPHARGTHQRFQDCAPAGDHAPRQCDGRRQSRRRQRQFVPGVCRLWRSRFARSALESGSARRCPRRIRVERPDAGPLSGAGGVG